MDKADDLKTLVQRHLTKGAWDTCPTCGGEKAEISDRFAAVPVHAGLDVRCAIVTCGYCGHLRLFSARVLCLPIPPGLPIPPDPPRTDP